MFVLQYSCVLLLREGLNKFCSVSNRNSLNLSISPSNKTSPKITFLYFKLSYRDLFI